MIGPGTLARVAGTVARRARGDYEEDAWGRDPQWAAAVQPALDLAYDRWWRVQTTGAEHVPAGRALIVANHAGVVPWDAAMMATALRRRPAAQGGPLDPRFLVLDWAFEVPFAGTGIRAFGGVPAGPQNARRLLEEDRTVMVFPEGAKGVGKPFSRRYRLERFGRGGFVEIALRAQAPIVPCAVVGSEEIYPKLGEATGLARLLGLPDLPLTPTFPWLGPLGLVPLPSRWRIAFGAPIAPAGPPEAAEDRALVLEQSDRVRDTIQGMLYASLTRRAGAFA